MTTWTTPRTWVYDELVDESKLNTHVRDNLSYLKEQLDISMDVVARQGGSSTNWNTAGTTTYTPTSLKVQTGTANVASVTTAYSTWYYGSVAVTFPEAFTNKPMVFGTVINLVANNIISVIITDVTTSGFTLELVSNASMSNQNVSWLALGA